MPQTEMEIVDRMYDAWNRDDFEAARPLLHPEIRFRPSGVFPGLKAEYRGPDGVREFWRDIREPFQSFQIHIEERLDRSGTIVHGLRFEAVGKGSGAKVELRFAHVWEVENGQIVRYASYPALEQALAAAG